MNDMRPVVEEPYEGSKKLFIVFGGIAAGVSMPPFEFYNSLRILQENRVFIRDFRTNMVPRGSAQNSRNILETWDYLARLIDRYRVDDVTMIGNSMGGFAAILFAALLGHVRAVAFAPSDVFYWPVKAFEGMATDDGESEFS